MNLILQNIALLRDLVDLSLAILIVTRLSRLLKGVLALRILSVLSALVAGHLLARFFSLHAVRLLIDLFLASSVVMLAVVFQTDIRKAFATLTRSRTEKDVEMSDVIDELVFAVAGLAQKKIGALIVIERAIQVDSYLAVGTDIDAKVTSELISSIFLPYSPIHDGAVIIQHGKLTKAGCFLPLTQNLEVSKSLGTRHRAAMGLSELVDAVVVVVSEETGTASIVVGGKKTDIVDMPSLGKTLRRLVEPRWLK
ncbi:Diadenylate cyclase spyDAC [Citrifermentans bremense]|uniref:Diadenylate cyclase n=2 Tax=Geobacteraceae TaxID=213422 RepID=A0ABQ0MI11_9BACT|nr:MULTISPECIES: diadenylate cyclase CdaA [Geobacteraceae]BCG46876.1 Diadenylate cyclase spyDAC [Citrifermentans bremense]GAW66713.1 membrane protein [Geoanaerobacter pelophilus]